LSGSLESSDPSRTFSRDEVIAWYADLELRAARSRSAALHKADIVLRKPRETEPEHLDRLSRAVERLEKTLGSLPLAPEPPQGGPRVVEDRAGEGPWPTAVGGSRPETRESHRLVGASTEASARPTPPSALDLDQAFE
jgi:hypothetical protein